MDISNIDHICLLVSNLETAKSYYEKIFNFKCRPHPSDEKVIMVESETVHFFIKEVNLPS